MSATILTIGPGSTIGPGVTLKVPVQKYSLGWDSTEHYVHITGNQSDWNLGDLWTIEWWEKLPDAGAGTYRGIIGQSVGNTCLDVWHNAGFINLSNAEIQITQPEPGVWHHIAVQKDSVTVTAYIDGVQQTLVRNNDGASTYTNSSLDLIIGDRTFNGSDPISQTFSGLLANIKISNVARYSGAFTPVITLTTDANTVLALSGELVDLTGRHTIINNGVAVSTDFPLPPPPGYVHTTEEEIVNNETILKYYETLPPSDRLALVDALRADELNVLARERAERTARNKALGVHTGKTIDEYSTSAWQIKQDYPDSEDGLYWIQNDAINNGDPVQVYCDMTTLGGGWTLIVQNSACEWQTDQVFLLNEKTAPAQLVGYDVQSIDYNYSILSWADKIKSAESGFDFMITAREHGLLGGAWKANEPYSFVQTFDGSDMGDAQLGTPGWRKNITELARWGTRDTNWNYDDNAMEARMPWVGIGINYGWLTTDGFRGGWWGTLVTGGGWNPAPWLSTIDGGPHPGVIWYWVR